MIVQNYDSKELAKRSVEVFEKGYTSYGKMKTAEYIDQTKDEIKNAALEHRKNKGYMTVRERMALKEKSM